MPRRPFYSQCCGVSVYPVPAVRVAGREYGWCCERCGSFTALTHLPLPVPDGDFVRSPAQAASGEVH